VEKRWFRRLASASAATTRRKGQTEEFGEAKPRQKSLVKRTKIKKKKLKAVTLS
jgi:hypothetical protein